MDTTKNHSKRNVGGKRVICKSTLLFPKIDVFNQATTSKSGVLVFNARGCSFYCKSQYDEKTITTIFNSGKPVKLPKIFLMPIGAPEISLANLQARFLKFKYLSQHTGMVLRFVHQTEPQLDALNFLTDSLPHLEESEESHVNALMTG